MKVVITHKNSGVDKKYYKFFDKFIKFINREYPLKKDVHVNFLGDRVGKMTTGSRSDNHVINILTKHRLNRDILRTLCHEWIHEYLRSVLKMKKGPDIGGPNENISNIIPGIMIKRFEK